MMHQRKRYQINNKNKKKKQKTTVICLREKRPFYHYQWIWMRDLWRIEYKDKKKNYDDKKQVKPKEKNVNFYKVKKNIEKDKQNTFNASSSSTTLSFRMSSHHIIIIITSISGTEGNNIREKSCPFFPLSIKWSDQIKPNSKIHVKIIQILAKKKKKKILGSKKYISIEKTFIKNLWLDHRNDKHKHVDIFQSIINTREKRCPVLFFYAYKIYRDILMNGTHTICVMYGFFFSCLNRILRCVCVWSVCVCVCVINILKFPSLSFNVFK